MVSIEHAASSHSMCRCCTTKIAAGALRIGYRVPSGRPYPSHYVGWEHVECYYTSRRAGQLLPDGLDDLVKAERILVKSLQAHKPIKDPELALKKRKRALDLREAKLDEREELLEELEVALTARSAALDKKARILKKAKRAMAKD